MIGWSVCIGNTIHLNLHQNFWKVHVAKEKPTLEMLKNEDLYRWQVLTDILNDRNDEDFDDKYAHLTFNADLGNATFVDLCEGGQEKTLTQGNCEEYVDLYLD